MNLTAALEINEALVGCRDHTPGPGSGPPEIGRWNLQQLIIATRVVEYHNAVCKDKKTIAVCTDRQIAALYAWRHYEAHPDPIVNGDGRALVCLESHE